MDKLTVRRKLLRGSLSAPVVLTVASPSNLAAASTACLANTPQTPIPTVFQSTTQPDVYFRVQTYLWNINYTSNGVTKTELFYQLGTNTTAFYRVSDGTLLVGTINTKTQQTSPVLALGYVDGDGNIKGYGWPSTAGGGQFTSIGCWNSLLIRP